MNKLYLFNKINKMGNKLQHFAKSSNFDPNIWEQIIPETHIMERKEKNFVTLRNRENGLMIDRYKVQFQDQDQRITYNFQIQQRCKLLNSIEIFGYQSPSYEQFCGNTYRIYLFTEHIPFRLQMVKKLSLSECLFVLSSAFKGFGELYSRKGFFAINQNLFAFNKLGKIKFWVNSNISKNSIEDSGRDIRQKSQRSMIMRILQIVSKKVDNQNYITNFLQFVRRINLSLLTFQQATNALKFYQNQLKVKPVPNISNNSLQRHNQNTVPVHNNQKANIKCSPMIKVVQKQIKMKIKKPLSCVKFHKTHRVQTLIPNFHNNFDQSKTINTIWREDRRKQVGHQRRYNTYLNAQERQGTLADDLVSDLSYISVQKPYTPWPVKANYFELELEESFQRNELHFSDLSQQKQQGRIKLGFEKKKRDNTSSSSPRDHLDKLKCKYSTVDKSVEIDPYIAQDLLKYL